MRFDIDTDRVGPDSSHPVGLPDLDDGDLFGDTTPVRVRVLFSNGQEATGDFVNNGVDDDFSQATVLLPSIIIPEPAHLGLFGLLGVLLLGCRRLPKSR